MAYNTVCGYVVHIHEKWGGGGRVHNPLRFFSNKEENPKCNLALEQQLKLKQNFII